MLLGSAKDKFLPGGAVIARDAVMQEDGNMLFDSCTAREGGLHMAQSARQHLERAHFWDPAYKGGLHVAASLTSSGTMNFTGCHADEEGWMTDSMFD